ncbi:MAG: hypothetical protein JO033_06340 [Acidobacteriaceae bacterium]|nr:hypothetical protein [Acidobacteriaceae bacterium]MBV9501708.1 hypothetical protein [Acidobacteriaceae bacterium]
MELIFEIRDAEEGGYFARALGHAIFTQAETWEELRSNVLEATTLHFENASIHPRLVQLHYVKDELIPVEAAGSCRTAYLRIAWLVGWNTSATV